MYLARFADRFSAAAHIAGCFRRAARGLLQPLLPVAPGPAPRAPPGRATGCGRRAQSLLSTAEAIDVDDKRLDDRLAQTALPGRHHAAAPVLQALHDGCLVGPVKPDLVGEIRPAELAVTLAFRPMAQHAIIGEHLLAEREIGVLLHGKRGQRADKIGHRRDLVGLEDAVTAKGRHVALVIVFVARARAVTDGFLDLGQLAAPQPVVVVEIGIAPGPATAGAVTGRAV